MTRLATPTTLRPCIEGDDTFLYDVFCTTWETEVAALPNPNLVQHVLRIQHIAQERRFSSRHPGHQKFVIVEDGQRVGRLYLHAGTSALQVVDLTLLPCYRSLGIGTRLTHDLFDHATERGLPITLRVPRRNQRATRLYSSLGFDVVRVDDLDSYFEWTPPSVAEGRCGLLAPAGFV
jgi:ribosomal protein S18 acetylase RimI-like enzyme